MSQSNLNNETVNLIEIAKTIKNNWLIFLISVGVMITPQA